MSLAQTRPRVTVEAILLERPAIKAEGSAKLNLLVTKVLYKGLLLNVEEKIRITVYRNMPDIDPGQRLSLPLTLAPFKNFNNPGRYNFEGAMKAKGFACGGYLSDGRYIVLMAEPRLCPLKSIMEAARSRFRRILQRSLGNSQPSTLNSHASHLLAALLLGERQTLDQELRDSFLRTGLSHVLAVSGLHIGLVAWLFYLGIKSLLSISTSLLLRCDVRRLSALLTAPPILGYVAFSGFQVSALRAMIMAYVFLGAMLLGREKDLWSSLSLAAIFIISLEPHALFQVSFQLSFLAVAGILWLGVPLVSRAETCLRGLSPRNPWLQKPLLYFSELFLIAMVAWFFLLPATAYYFHQASLIGVFANALVVPIIGLWVLPFGLLSAATSLISVELAQALLPIASIGSEAALWIVGVLDRIPLNSVLVPIPNFLEIIAFYLSVFFGWASWKWKRPWAIVAVMAIAGFWLADLGFWIWRVKFRNELSVTFLDVGQGNSAFVQLPNGKKILIDGGGFRPGGFDVGRNVVAPFLLYNKILKVDYLVLTHPQADHMNGLIFIAKHFEPKELWYNGERPQDIESPVQADILSALLQTMKQRGAKIKRPKDLALPFPIGKVTFQVLHPFEEESVREPNPNNRSLVLKMTYQGIGFLFPGDIEKKAEQAILKRKPEALASHVLLSPHHGSNTSSHPAFIRAVGPKFCVISCRQGSKANFPHPDVIKTLRRAGCIILRTDILGAITIMISEGRFKIQSFTKGTILDRPLPSLVLMAPQGRCGWRGTLGSLAHRGQSCSWAGKEVLDLALKSIYYP